MIVKNEAPVIKRCLDSLQVEKWIDYFLIVDTGSTDGTQDIIRNYFADKQIDGAVVEYPFTDFADCRNVAFQHIKDKVNYVFWIDADEELTFNKGFSFLGLKKIIENYDYAYFRCVNNGFQFRNNHLFSTDLEWKWYGCVHEYIEVVGVEIMAKTTIEGCQLVYNEDGNSWGDKIAKAHKHIELLEKQHEEEPCRGRWLFYLGQTWRAIPSREAKEKAVSYYEARVALYKRGREPEVYVSKLMSLCLRQELGQKLLPYQFEECADYDDSRIEHVMHANAIYREQKNYSAAYAHSKEAYKKYMKPPLGISELLLDLSVYTFSCAHVHAINCYYTRRAKEGLAVLELLKSNIKAKRSPALVSEGELYSLGKALHDLK